MFENKRGAFIIFEGSGCVGKSSAIDGVKDYLTEQNLDHVIIMNHANSDFTMGLRKVLADWGSSAEEHSKTFIYAAIWNQLYTTTIKPALDAGKIVLLDRYIPSTYFFQASSGEVAITSIMSNVNHLIADACIYMTCELDEVTKRIEARSKVRDDRYNLDFIKNSLKFLPEYKNAANMFADRLYEIDTTNLSKEESANHALEAIKTTLQELAYEQVRN